MSASPPLVLMHGLWDTPRLFRRLIQALDQPPEQTRGVPETKQQPQRP